MTELLTLDMGESLSPRPARQGLTSRLTDVWPEVEVPLRRFLASLGAQRAELEDIVQEVAARVLALDIPYQDAADLRRWCFVVARRLWLDERRRGGRSVELALCIGQQDLTAARALSLVEDRMLLEKVQVAVAQLPLADRSALEAPRPATPSERNKLNVARHRARRRLRELVGPFSIIVWLQGRQAARTSRHVWLAGAAFVAAGAIVGVTWQHTTVAPRTRPAVLDAGVVSVDRVAPATITKNLRAQERITGLTGPVATVAPARTPADDAVALGTRGPKGSWVGARIRPNDGHQPLVCTGGTLGRLCIDIPRLPPVDGAPR